MQTSFTFQKVDATAEEERYTSFKAQRHSADVCRGRGGLKRPFRASVFVLLNPLRVLGRNKENGESVKSGYLAMHLKK